MTGDPVTGDPFSGGVIEIDDSLPSSHGVQPEKKE